MSGTGFGPLTLMGAGGYGVEHHGHGLWRAVYVDDLGTWSITGPPFRTKAEAMLFWSAGQLSAIFGTDKSGAA